MGLTDKANSVNLSLFATGLSPEPNADRWQVEEGLFSPAYAVRKEVWPFNRRGSRPAKQAVAPRVPFCWPKSQDLLYLGGHASAGTNVVRRNIGWQEP